MNLPILAALKKRNPVVLVALGLLVAGIGFGAYRYWHKLPYHQGASSLHVDLRYPDMVLRSKNLAEFPKDVAKAEILKGLVDEDLVFHYEEDEARLSIEGSLRRLAYEHNLELQDHFLATLLAAPAEVAMWRSGKGRPEHFVAKLERGVLAKLTEALAKIALDDRQLKQAGTFSFGGNDVSLFTLSYGGGRTMAFAGLGEHWVFLSDPRLVLNENNELTEDGAMILNDLLHGKQPWKERLPSPNDAKHAFIIDQQALTMEYGHFLSGLTGMRFDYKGNTWQPSLRLSAMRKGEQEITKYDTKTIWRSLPIGAAFCTALPVDWQTVNEPMQALLGNNPAIAQMTTTLDPVAVACWYPNARISAPLFVARATQALPAQSGELLSQLSQKAWRVPASETKASDGKTSIFSATIPSRHGYRAKQGEERRFNMALAQSGNLIFFSPDQRQVEAALAVAAKRAPALGDEPGMQNETWLMFEPALVSKLVQAEVQEVLPADEESFFREVARSRLWPRLEGWGKQHQAVAMQAGRNDENGYVALSDKPLKGRNP